MEIKRDRNICNLIKVITVIIYIIYVKYVSGSHLKTKGQFYIFLWTNRAHNTFMFLEESNKVFIDNHCLFQNCFIVNTTSYLRPVTEYDALLFNAVTLHAKPTMLPPYLRSLNQKYVLVSLESAATYPIAAKYNYFFNWTWTYKLNSDINFAYILIKHKDGKVIGPKQDMHWIRTANMKDTNLNIVKKLKNKTIAAAWIVSNCDTMMSKHEPYVKGLRHELGKYKQALDIFGQCGNMKCPDADFQKCYEVIERQYYFYLVFEDSMAEDYVTDQLLIALNHFAVPVVFGGANYTRYVYVTKKISE